MDVNLLVQMMEKQTEMNSARMILKACMMVHQLDLYLVLLKVLLLDIHLVLLTKMAHHSAIKMVYVILKVDLKKKEYSLAIMIPMELNSV